MGLESVPQYIFVRGEIHWGMIGDVVEKIYTAYNSKEKCRQFILPILSPGGDVDAAWSLYTVLKNLDAEIITLAAGRVYSSAVIPFLAGHKRYSFPQSVFLFHPATITHASNEEVPLYRYHEEIQGEKFDRLTFKSILSSIKGTRKDIVNALVHDSKSSYINARKAKSYKIVTDIINKPERIRF
jgi:ATP-dependent protease ClpP protease subunit